MVDGVSLGSQSEADHLQSMTDMKTFSTMSPGTEWEDGKEMTQTFEAFIPPQILHLPPKKLHQHLIVCPLFDSVQPWTISTFIAPQQFKVECPQHLQGRQGVVNTALKSPQKRKQSIKANHNSEETGNVGTNFVVLLLILQRVKV